MEGFKMYFREQLLMHPSVQPRDVAKLCYQAAFGAEHLLADVDGVRRYFDGEFADTPADESAPLYERISNRICRVNLGAWKAAGLDGGELFRMFADTASVGGDHETLRWYLDAAETVLESMPHDFSHEEWTRFRAAYEAAGMPAVRHSEKYREAEKPAYRIVDAKYFNQKSCD